MTRVRRVLTHPGAQTAVSSAVVAIVTFVTGLATARLLDPDQRGTLAAVMAFSALIGQSAAIGPGEARLLADSRGASGKKLLAIAWAVAGGIALPGAIGVVVYASAMGINGGLVLAAAALSAVSSAAAGLSAYQLLSEGRVGVVSLLRAAAPVLQLMLIVVVWLTSAASVGTLLIVSFIGGAVVCVTSILISRPWSVATNGSSMATGGFVRLIAITGFTNGVRIWGYRIDLILLGLLTPGPQLGVYAVALSLPSAANSFVANLAPLLLTNRISAASQKFSQSASALAMIIAAGIWLVGTPLIPVVFGRDYDPGFALMGVLSATFYLGFVADLLSRTLQRSGSERLVLYVYGMILLLQLVMISLGASFVGIIGAAIGNLIAYVLGVVLILVVGAATGSGGSLLRGINPVRGLHVLSTSLLFRASPPSSERQ